MAMAAPASTGKDMSWLDGIKRILEPLFDMVAAPPATAHRPVPRPAPAPATANTADPGVRAKASRRSVVPVCSARRAKRAKR